jgi:hypothetical protein
MSKGTARLGIRRSWPLIACVLFLVTLPGCTDRCSTDPGRRCVPSAGLSLVLPEGWSPKDAEDGALFAVAPDGVSDIRVVIETGTSVFHDAVPTTLDAVQQEITSRASGSSWPTAITDLQFSRAPLPIGPALRASFSSATNFILTYSQTTVSYWFYVDGRLLAIEYDVAYGEDTPIGPDSVDAVDLQALLLPLQALPPQSAPSG